MYSDENWKRMLLDVYEKTDDVKTIQDSGMSIGTYLWFKLLEMNKDELLEESRKALEEKKKNPIRY